MSEFNIGFNFAIDQLNEQFRLNKLPYRAALRTENLTQPFPRVILLQLIEPEQEQNNV